MLVAFFLIVVVAAATAAVGAFEADDKDHLCGGNLDTCVVCTHLLSFLFKFVLVITRL